MDAKAHGLGYLMSPIAASDPDHDWHEDAWKYVLHNEMVHFEDVDYNWLDCPAMLKVPVTSPAVLGRLKNFTKPYDFVLAPIVDGEIDLDEQAEKPILITRFEKDSAKWENATFYNVRTGKPCRITAGKSKDQNVVNVKTYREILNCYAHNPESKFLSVGGTRCDWQTRGILQRDHVIAMNHIPCGKETKRQLGEDILKSHSSSQGAEIDFGCRVYSNGKIAGNPEILRNMAKFTEREISVGTGVHRKPIRKFRNGGTVTRRIYKKLVTFLNEREKGAK